MRYQRGITTGWILAIVVAVIAILWLALQIQKEWTSYTERLDKQGYDRGHATALKDVGDRDNLALQKAIKERNTAQAGLDASLKVNQELQKTSDAAYRKGKNDGKAQYDRDLSAIQSGALVLRLHKGDAPSGSGLRNTAGNNDKIAGSGPGSTGTGDDRLPDDDSRFLLWLQSEATRLGKKVNALIDIVKGDRAQINGAWNEQGHPVLQMAESIH